MAPGVKGEPVRVFSNQAAAMLADIAVDCRCANALNVEVRVSGSSPSATISVEGAPERGGNYLPLRDPEASRSGVAADTSFDVVVGTAWARIRLADVSGSFGYGRGFTVIATPYIAPAQGRLAITFGA